MGFTLCFIKPGKEYYIRRNTMGVMVARPKLELINNEKGKIEYETLKRYKRYLRQQMREQRREQRRKEKRNKK